MAPTPKNDFQTFIHNARERKKNEDLATKIFSSKNRRQSAPSNLKTAAPGGSLASRVGVKKQRASSGTKAAPKPAGNINGEWTHDLHSSVSGDKRSLGARISAPGNSNNNNNNNNSNSNTPAAASAATRSQRKSARKTAALERMDVDSAVQQQANMHPAPPSKGISIRGLAGPFTVMAQNFAPGTTAADVESAMTPIGGEMESCRVVKTKPFIMVEMVFLSKEGGERVIETFNDNLADGQVLKVYPKIGGLPSSSSNRAAKDIGKDQIIDGSLGFPDPNQKHQLYSDRLVGGGNSNRRGRGGQRGRGSR